jgi:capsular polysaccharide transport system permease protein
MDAIVREAAGSDVDTQSRAGAATTASRMQRLWRWVKRHHLFLLTVALPTLAATAYYGLIASDVYISESEFIVYSPEQKTQTGGIIGQFLQGTGMSKAQDAAYAVEDYVKSRDALQALNARLNLRNAFNSPDIDIFDRFPGLRWDHSFEEFFKYYGKHIDITYDSVSSISTLRVSAYTARDAYRINQLLLSMSEQLVNNLNERSRQDMIRFAENDVQAAEEKATQASLALLAYRSEHAVFQPNKQATIQLEAVAKLQAELVSTEAELAQLRQLSPDNPQITGLESRAETLRNAIGTQATKVTGSSDSLSARAPEFERLALESTIADKELGLALAELDSARQEAARQELYVERLVQPNLPDYALLPMRLRSILTILFIGLMVWGVLALILASIREHSA